MFIFVLIRNYNSEQNNKEDEGIYKGTYDIIVEIILIFLLSLGCFVTLVETKRMMSVLISLYTLFETKHMMCVTLFASFVKRTILKYLNTFIYTI